jgi:hypothetical protein
MGAACLVPPFGVFGAALAILIGTTLGVAVRCATLARLMASLRTDSADSTRGGPG